MEDLKCKFYTISVLCNEISFPYNKINVNMWTILACIVLCVITWRKKICLYRTISETSLNDIKLSLSLITLLDPTVVTKIWATIWKKTLREF